MATKKKPVPKKKPPAKKVAAVVKQKLKTGPKPVAMQKMDALGIDKLCAAIVEGNTLTAIAKATSVSIGSLITWVEANPERSARAREARAQVARLWDELALQGIADAMDNFQLAKAKESAHHLRWRAAKIAPKEYGDKLALGQADDLLPFVMVKDMTGKMGPGA